MYKRWKQRMGEKTKELEKSCPPKLLTEIRAESNSFNILVN